MAESTKVSLVGFDLDPSEDEIVQNTVKTYVRKIEERTGFEQLKITLKKSRHGDAYLHEVQGELFSGKWRLSANTKEYNLLSALSEVFEKILNEIEHKKRTSRQTENKEKK
jgi:hypothetical protein